MDKLGELYRNGMVVCKACNKIMNSPETDKEIAKLMIEKFVGQYDKSACVFYQDLMSWLDEEQP